MEHANADRSWAGEGVRVRTITPRAREPTAIGSLITRALAQPPTAATQLAAAGPAGAAAHHPMDWQAMDWPQVDGTVRRLQARLVKAAQAGRRGTVKARPRLRTHAFSSHALAVRRVPSPHGQRTPGVDGVPWTTPAPKRAAVHALRPPGSRPQP
jgi:N-terminal domain of reverse transcriptase